MIMIYDIDPCAKARMTRSDKWKQRPCVMKYRAFKDRCRSLNVKLYERMDITFYMPMPKSWSNKKRQEMFGWPHKTKPDIDNMIKAMLDILPEDSHIHEIHARKIWSTNGKIKINKMVD